MHYGNTFMVQCGVSGLEVLDKDQNPIDRDVLYQLIYGLQQLIPHYVYIGEANLDSPNIGLFKIGISDDPDRRAKELKIDLWNTIECEAWERHEIERVVHGFCIERGCWVKGEWFALDSKTLDLLSDLDTSGDVLEKCETYLDWQSRPPSKWEVHAAYKKYPKEPLRFWKEDS